eukprot:767582-Hanusia_phi.AAC.2
MIGQDSISSPAPMSAESVLETSTVTKTVRDDGVKMINTFEIPGGQEAWERIFRKSSTMKSSSGRADCCACRSNSAATRMTANCTPSRRAGDDQYARKREEGDCDHEETEASPLCSNVRGWCWGCCLACSSLRQTLILMRVALQVIDDPDSNKLYLRLEYVSGGETAATQSPV